MVSSLSQVAYQRILQTLLSPGFRADRRISETALARELGISRTPIREAIRRLQSEGFLYQVRCRGTFVAKPNRRQLLETYEVREALECQAVAKATRRMTSQQRAELQSLCEKMLAAITAMRDAGSDILDGEPLRQYLTADLAFHLLVLQAAGNRMAMKIIADSRARDCIFGHRSHHRNLHHVAWVWLVHARIARAVLRRDNHSARRWMRQHIQSSGRDAVAAFDAHLAAQESQGAAPADIADSLEQLVDHLTAPFPTS